MARVSTGPTSQPYAACSGVRGLRCVPEYFLVFGPAFAIGLHTFAIRIGTQREDDARLGCRLLDSIRKNRSAEVRSLELAPMEVEHGPDELLRRRFEHWPAAAFPLVFHLVDLADVVGAFYEMNSCHVSPSIWFIKGCRGRLLDSLFTPQF